MAMPYVLGYFARQCHVRQPFASVMPVATPLPAATSGAGTMMCSSTAFGLPIGWSMQGQNRSQPSPWTALATHGLPSGVRAHTKPPSHGAPLATCGSPWYVTRTLICRPGSRRCGKSIVSLPSGLRHRLAGSGWPSTAMASIGRLRSRSSSMLSSGALALNVSVASPRRLRLSGSMRRPRSAWSNDSACCVLLRWAPELTV